MEVIKACDVGIGEFMKIILRWDLQVMKFSPKQNLLYKDLLILMILLRLLKYQDHLVFFSSNEINAFLSLEDDNYRKSLGSEGFKWIQEYSSFANTKKINSVFTKLNEKIFIETPFLDETSFNGYLLSHLSYRDFLKKTNIEYH